MTGEHNTLDPKLLQRLRSKKPAIRDAAELELIALGPGAVEMLLRTIDSEEPKRQRNRKLGIAVICLWLTLVVVMVVADGAKNIGSMGGVMASLGALFAATSVQKNAAGALARFDDKRAAGPLTDALEYQDGDVAKASTSALTRILPTLTASDHALLTTPHRRILDRAIVKPKQAELSLAILKAFEQIGDEASVAVVEKIADGQTKAARDPRVVQEARAILPAMRTQAEMVKAAQTLLRPVMAGVGSETLLRPVAPGASPDVSTLVRPASADGALATVEAAAPSAETAQEQPQQAVG